MWRLRVVKYIKLNSIDLKNGSLFSWGLALIFRLVSDDSSFKAIVVILNTGMPCFLKIHFMPLRCYKRPTLVPVFTSQKKSKDFFLHLWKRKLLLCFTPFQLMRGFARTLCSEIAEESCSSFLINVFKPYVAPPNNWGIFSGLWNLRLWELIQTNCPSEAGILRCLPIPKVSSSLCWMTSRDRESPSLVSYDRRIILHYVSVKSFAQLPSSPHSDLLFTKHFKYSKKSRLIFHLPIAGSLNSPIWNFAVVCYPSET